MIQPHTIRRLNLLAVEDDVLWRVDPGNNQPGFISIHNIYPNTAAVHVIQVDYDVWYRCIDAHQEVKNFPRDDVDPTHDYRLIARRLMSAST